MQKQRTKSLEPEKQGRRKEHRAEWHKETLNTKEMSWAPNHATSPVQSSSAPGPNHPQTHALMGKSTTASSVTSSMRHQTYANGSLSHQQQPQHPQPPLQPLQQHNRSQPQPANVTSAYQNAQPIRMDEYQHPPLADMPQSGVPGTWQQQLPPQQPLTQQLQQDIPQHQPPPIQQQQQHQQPPIQQQQQHQQPPIQQQQQHQQPPIQQQQQHQQPQRQQQQHQPQQPTAKQYSAPYQNYFDQAPMATTFNTPVYQQNETSEYFQPSTLQSQNHMPADTDLFNSNSEGQKINSNLNNTSHYPNNNNNNNSNHPSNPNDGWGDWGDWNENARDQGNNSSSNNNTAPPTNHNNNTSTKNNNSNNSTSNSIIEDSFNVQFNNEWNWTNQSSSASLGDDRGEETPSVQLIEAPLSSPVSVPPQASQVPMEALQPMVPVEQSSQSIMPQQPIVPMQPMVPMLPQQPTVPIVQSSQPIVPVQPMVPMQPMVPVQPMFPMTPQQPAAPVVQSSQSMIPVQPMVPMPPQPTAAANVEVTAHQTAFAEYPVGVPPMHATNAKRGSLEEAATEAYNPVSPPSSVYVSQAKPVARPPRQFASPPGALSPPDALEDTLTPPQAFQNEAAAASTATAPLSVPPQAGVTMAPPPLGTSGGNPFKRAGAVQYHRSTFMAAPPTTPMTLPTATAAPPQVLHVAPPPPADFANEARDLGSVPIEDYYENQEVVAAPSSAPVAPIVAAVPQAAPPPHDDRNRYLQTSHFSETVDEELIQIAEGGDHMPPPGLSRLVLGQPETEAEAMTSVSQRRIAGEDRHADGEDNSADQMGAVSSTNAGGQVAPSLVASGLDVIADRNLYRVPGESHAAESRRVVTGVETAEAPIVTPPAVVAAPEAHANQQQRELELDGENLEDAPSRNESQPVASHSEGAAKPKDLSNISSENDEGSDLEPDEESRDRKNLSRNTQKARKHVGDVDKRSDKGAQQRKERPRKDRDNHSYYEKRRYNRYDDETEESLSRHELSRKGDVRRSGRAPDAADRSARSDRSEREYEDYDRTRGQRGSRRNRTEIDRNSTRRREYIEEDEDIDRRDRRHRRERERERDRDDFDTSERRRRGGGGSSKQYSRTDPREFEEYRKQSSRNARESDLEQKEPRSNDPRFGANMYGGYPGAMYGYDPYTYYYEQMARNNPQAYSEWYRKYYGSAQIGATGASALGPGGVVNAGEQVAAGGSSVGATDGRESVHSGRSSVHNEKDRLTQAYITQANEYHQRHYHNSQYHQQQMLNQQHNRSMNPMMHEEGSLRGARSTSNLSQSALSGGNGGSSFYNIPKGKGGVYYARSEYGDSRAEKILYSDAAPQHQDAQRLTPCKFANEHVVASLSGAGILATVRPRYSAQGGAAAHIVRLQRLNYTDSAWPLINAFPGPLVRGLTHKKTVIEFCEEQIRRSKISLAIYAHQLPVGDDEKYRASYTLLWNLLILLLRQNGMVVGTDIAELLLKNQAQFPYDTPLSTDASSVQSDSKSRSATPETNEGDNTPSEKTSLLEGASGASEANVTEKFRNYLLYGNVNEALDWATDNNLWGHALFLASKVDRRSHANVMMKFANKLALNDPLQTLYQLMSGRTPSSVTSVQDARWGDWRPHLSMILSNTSQKPELDRKSITTLGDSLFNRGDLFAAHFCYLMAQVGFGRYDESATQLTSLHQQLPKLVLLGSSHYQQFSDFATNEAITTTEIYEYACSLNNEKFSLPEFQPYKYLLATRLLDYGCHLKSLMYMEQIALHVQRDPEKYTPSFIEKVYAFADRLKYFDPVLDRSIDDQQQQQHEANPSDGGHAAQSIFKDQQWLQDLGDIAMRCSQVHGYNVGAAMPEYGGSVQQQQIDQQFVEINKQFNELNLQYSELSKNREAEAGSPTFYNPATMEPPSLTGFEQQQQQQQQQLPMPVGGDEEGSNKLPTYAEPYAGYEQQYEQPLSTSYYDPTAHQNQQPQSQYGTEDSAYDYWAHQQQQQQQLQQQQQHHQDFATEETATRPTISMPKSRTYSDSDNDIRPQQQQRKGSNGGMQQRQSGGRTEQKDGGKSVAQGNQNSGWFGGIWNKLSLKPKNQMILPDDKNPTIVWDPDRKRWVNTDGDEAVEQSTKPPPKMSDLMQSSQPLPQSQPLQPQPLQPQHQLQQQQHPSMQSPYMPVTQPYPAAVSPAQPAEAALPAGAPSAVPSGYSAASSMATAPGQQSAAPKGPSLQSNMFKMQRNRTLKNSYVDVFNPSGAPMPKASENILAPSLPPATAPQSGFFIPGAVPDSQNQQSQQQQQQQQQQQPQQAEVPQFYNVNQFSSASY